ncbi:ABC transporter ATP-binding protein [Flexivirga oryzae]|uniref:Branched-chain amino acid transport system ATP-binding protein n=1 Tax=Flexivirga oryzae TaxID=1794944 RepID=A0A839NDI8_9MICO|nr:ABC transporter ATP-binding protein [Flexivirga oryzae]MBB2892751.1 branched-chain amino acid transport system ATP-binding protein [Flexivirga oryzae]
MTATPAELPARAVLQATGLTCTIGGAAIVSDVDLGVQDGELLGVIGPNGAGKTSLLNLLSGLLPATSGAVQLDGQNISGWSPHRRARAGLGRTFQTSSVFGELSVAENVSIAAQAFLGGNLRLWQPATRIRGRSERAGAALELVGLAGRAGIAAGSLSHGDKRKLELAILLAGEPKVMMLDEPMAGVSAEDVPELTELIGRVRRERGATVIMVEHHMDVILQLADRLAVMHHGSLLLCDTPQVVMADATVQEAYLGGAL